MEKQHGSFKTPKPEATQNNTVATAAEHTGNLQFNICNWGATRASEPSVQHLSFNGTRLIKSLIKLLIFLITSSLCLCILFYLSFICFLFLIIYYFIIILIESTQTVDILHFHQQSPMLFVQINII